MPKFKLIFLPFFIISLLVQINLFPQDTDIIKYLKQIEDGNRDQVKEKLASLKAKYPDSPSILFLEGVLADDGNLAVSIYNKLLNNYPKSRYADAALYRICTYNYALGNYSVFKINLNRLRKEYPNSAYIKLADRNIPDEDEIVGKEKSNPDDVETGKTIAAADSESYKYTIQAGAFTVADNAKIFKSQLDSAGYYSRMEDKIVAGTSFHIVYVGKFVNHEDARNFLTLLNKKFNLTGRIVSLNKVN